MKREQLEANWGWDPERGSIPFKRPRLTPKNIRDQRKLARPGTLIHWAGKPCARGLKKIDQHPANPVGPRLSQMEVGVGTVTSLALAGHIDNVNCLQCRSSYFRGAK